MSKLILTEKESDLTEKELFFKWLIENRISFTDLSVEYTLYLEKVQKENSVLISSMAVPLTSLIEKPNKNDLIFFKCKAAFNLIKTQMFKGTPFEEKLKNLVERYKYNEDENGYKIAYFR